MSHEQGRGLSITAMTIAVALVMSYFLWGVSCAMYLAAQPRVVNENGVEESAVPEAPRVRGRAGGLVFAAAGVATFVSKSFTMLPELPGVLAFLFRERLWFVAVALGILAGVVFFGLFLKRLELALEGPKKKKRRRRR